MNEIPVIDLFAGAGGITLGAEMAGGETRLLVELDRDCCETLRSNHDAGLIVESDIGELTGRSLRSRAGLSATDPLLIVGGAPCQPFSKAAYWTDPGHDARYRRARAKGKRAQRPDPIFKAKPDSRRNLICEFERIVRESKAVGFLFENVPSILHPRNVKEFQAFRSRLEAAGYLTTLVQANAAHFGVPQKRHRVFLLGSKIRRPVAPGPTHSLEKSDRLLPAVTTAEAIRRYASALYHEPEEVVAGRWADHLREVPPGSNYKALTAWAGHPNPTFEAESRFWNFLLKLSPRAPSWTLAASPGPWTGPFHWDSRRLRTVELAAIQTFPHGYRFAGSRRERVRQIGNAVPPLLAKAMVSSVIQSVSETCKSRSGKLNPADRN